MDGVTFQNTGAGEITSDEIGVVIPVDRFPRGDARQNALSSAGETGEEMRLDEAFADEKIRLRRHTVDAKLTAGGKGSDGDHILLSGAVMNDDVFVFYDFLTEFFNQLCPGGAAVAAGGN